MEKIPVGIQSNNLGDVILYFKKPDPKVKATLYSFLFIQTTFMFHDDPGSNPECYTARSLAFTTD
jgi:hypothetical protein